MSKNNRTRTPKKMGFNFGSVYEETKYRVNDILQDVSARENINDMAEEFDYLEDSAIWKRSFTEQNIRHR